MDKTIEKKDTKMNIAQKLIAIQGELKSPKTQVNTFGKYNYRKTEDILEAVKPLCKRYGCGIVIRDEVEECGGRLFIKSVAILIDDKDQYGTYAYAELATDKKGMDAAQVTGATSSYARKTALSGLLAIDNNADPDSFDIRVKLANAETMDDLVAIWGTLSVKAQAKYSGVFKQRKQELNEENHEN
ncbi:MAG: ERF family protein [Muribaculaceae bacterium]|nr:ERF family protein [Muribaculaceae bacterium]